MNTTTHNKPLGFWLAVVEHCTHDAMRTAFADQDVSRREWRLLSVIGNSPVTISELRAALPPRRRAGKSRGLRHHAPAEGDAGRPQRPLHRSTAEVVAALVERGWVSYDGGMLTITDEGSRMSAQLGERVASMRSSIGTGISDADYTTTVTTLETMARNLGWSEESPHPQRRRHGFRE